MTTATDDEYAVASTGLRPTRPPATATAIPQFTHDHDLDVADAYAIQQRSIDRGSHGASGSSG
jgi:hypothetical protein